MSANPTRYSPALEWFVTGLLGIATLFVVLL
jgi:hypothetical protein